MALFGSKKNKENKEGENGSENSVQSLEIRPRFTEKAMLSSDSSVYTFVVPKNATKESVRSRVISQYGKTPLKIRISILPSKMRRRGKKAFVYLAKGEKIEFV